MIPVPVVSVFTADGSAPLGVVRAVASLKLSDVFCDLGSLELALPKNVPGAQYLLTDEDRQIRVRMAGCPDFWFLLDEDKTTFVSDAPESEDVAVTLRSLAGVLDEAKVIPQAGIGDTDPSWVFEDATPGKIVADLFAAIQALGFLEGITLTGGAAADTDGAAWPETYTQTYQAGQSLLDVLKGLADLQLIEWRMNERTLELFVPGGGLDRTLTRPFRPGRDVTAAPYQRARRAIATDVLVQDVDGMTVLRSQALTGRRKRMAFLSQAPATAGAAAGDLYLAAHADVDVQMTHDLTDGETTPVPWRDYRCGDRVPTLAGGRGVSVERVSQIVLSYDADDTSVSLELGSIQASADEIFDKKLRQLNLSDQ